MDEKKRMEYEHKQHEPGNRDTAPNPDRSKQQVPKGQVGPQPGSEVERNSQANKDDGQSKQIPGDGNRSTNDPTKPSHAGPGQTPSRADPPIAENK